MKQALTTAGIGSPKSLEEFISLASKNGFDGIDVAGEQIVHFIEKNGLEGSKAILKESGIHLASIGLSVEWRQDEITFQQGLAKLTLQAEAAASLGVKSCCTYILPSVDQEAAPFTAIAIRRLRLCASILEAYDIKLGLEFVGPHHLRTQWKNLFIYDLPGLQEMIAAIDRPNVGILLDSIHWHTTEATVADILKLSSSEIVHVHINDAPDISVEQVLDNGRLLPGEGVIKLSDFLHALQKIGYEGYVSQEVLTKTAPTHTVEEMIQKSRVAFDKVFASVTK